MSVTNLLFLWLSFTPPCSPTGTPTWAPARSKSTPTCLRRAHTRIKSGGFPKRTCSSSRVGKKLQNFHRIHSCSHVLLSSSFTRNECFQLRRTVSLNGYIGMVETFSSYQVMLKKDPAEAQRLSQHIRTRSVFARSQLRRTRSSYDII